MQLCSTVLSPLCMVLKDTSSNKARSSARPAKSRLHLYHIIAAKITRIHTHSPLLLMIPDISTFSLVVVRVYKQKGSLLHVPQTAVVLIRNRNRAICENSIGVKRPALTTQSRAVHKSDENVFLH